MQRMWEREPLTPEQEESLAREQADLWRKLEENKDSIGSKLRAQMERRLGEINNQLLPTQSEKERMDDWED